MSRRESGESLGVLYQPPTKKPPREAAFLPWYSDAPGGNRTHDLRLERPMLFGPLAEAVDH